jgi:hypothetical protein
VDSLVTALQVCFPSSHVRSLAHQSLTGQQLLHMRHFTEPLTILHADSSSNTLENSLSEDTEANTHAFFDALLTRLAAPRVSHSVPPDHVSAWTDTTLDTLLDDVRQARTAFWDNARRLRVGWKVGRVASGVVHEVTNNIGGRRMMMRGQGEESGSLVETMGAYMRGRGGRAFVAGVGWATFSSDFLILYFDTSKLHGEDLRKLTNALQELFDEVNEGDALESILDFSKRIDEDEADEQKLANELGKWLGSFVSCVNLHSLEKLCDML